MQSFFDQFFQILINGGIILGIFVVLLLNNRGVRKSRANIFLSVLLVALSFSVFHVRYAANVFSHFSVRTFLVGDPTFLLITPLLWFYLVELTGGRVRFGPAIVLHFVPFLIIVFCSLYLQHLYPDHPIITFLGNHKKLPVVFFWLVVVAQFSGYQLYIHRKWSGYQQYLKQERSNTDNVNVGWIRFFVALFLIVNVAFLISLFIVLHTQYSFWIFRANGVVFSLAIFALGYKGVLQKEVFHTEESHDEMPATIPVAVTRVDVTQLEAVRKHMLEHRPYLDAEVSLSSLAKQVGLTRGELSQLINHGVGDNFYDFVNRYRVEEVKRLMADPKFNNYSLLGLALESGFKSKSTFNLIFKRFTGLTPSEYRKNVQP